MFNIILIYSYYGCSQINYFGHIWSGWLDTYRHFNVFLFCTSVVDMQMLGVSRQPDPFIGVGFFFVVDSFPAQ